MAANMPSKITVGFVSIITAILLSFLKGLSAPCGPVHKPKTGKQAFFPNLKLPQDMEESTALI